MKVIVKKKNFIFVCFFWKEGKYFFFLVREDNFCIRIVKFKFM